MPSFSATTGGTDAAAHAPGGAPAGSSVGAVVESRARFDAPLPLACGVALPSYELAYETYGTLNASAVERGAGLPRAERIASRRRLLRRRSRRTSAGGTTWSGPGKPLDTDRFFVVGVNNLGSCFGSTGPLVDQSGDRRAVGRRLPDGHRRGLGRRAGAARRPSRHQALGRGDGRQPGRHAGARLGDPLSGSHPSRAGDRRRAEPLRAEHRVQRGRAAGDPDRPRLSRRPLRRRTTPSRGAACASRG